MKTKLILPIALALMANALAQSPGPNLPRPDRHFGGFVGGTYRDSDPATFPPQVKASKGAPTPAPSFSNL